MRKNISGQKIGAQMIDASTGAAFTSSVTVYVTGDAGTQAAGSVGSGACTHEGNGYHTYAPAQAETNYDLVAFTFVGTGAVPQTVQVYTTSSASSLTAEDIADMVATRGSANWENDVEVGSIGQAALEATHKSNTTTNVGYVTVRNAADSADLYKRSISTNATAEPLTGVGARESA